MKLEGYKMEEMVKLSPVFKDYLWGGTRLLKEYGKTCDLDKVAESWELSTNKDGQSVIAEGIHKGMSLSDYLKEAGEEKLGKKCQGMAFFPLMIKLIDAKSNLSIQVHPEDEYAMRVENSYGKNEMWYILDCEEGAYLYVGFKENVTKEEVEQKVKDNCLTDILNKIYVKKGQAVFIKAGTVHAIGAGNVICEIQQNSNVTYRLYDYGRTDKEGNQRELHLEKALDVLNLNKQEMEIDSVFRKIESAYFSTYRYLADENKKVTVDKDSFVSLVFLEGRGIIKDIENKISLSYKKGDTFFMCAGDNTILVEGSGEYLVVRM